MRLYESYPRFYRTAGLTPEQIQKFEQLMVASEEEKRDLGATLQAQRPGPEVAEKLRRQMNEKLQAAQLELLGADGYRQLQDFQRAKHQDVLVTNVVDAVALTAEAFTEAQREQLLKVLVANTRPDVGASAKSQWNSYIVLSSAVDWPSALAQAQTFLSPAQFVAFKGNAGNSEIWALVREFSAREGIPLGKN